MTSRLVKIVGAIVAGALVALACGGIASAGQADKKTPTTHTVAAQLQQLHGQLQTALDGKDGGAVRSSVDSLRPIFAQLKATPLARTAAQQTFRADNLAEQVQRGLLPGGPDPFAVITNLLRTLLGAVLDLVTGLLGGLPVPVPDLPVDLPLPLPGAPEPGAAPQPGGLPLPLPDLPVDLPLPLPGAPEPGAAPQPPAAPPAAEQPAAPAPGAPAPDVPEPAVPAIPSLPIP